MHPVLLMAHEESEALTNAKKTLEDAGLKVKILYTGTANLIDFLGALADVDAEPAGEKEEGDTPAAEPEVQPETDVAAEPAEQPEPKMEALVDFERVKVKIVEGESCLIVTNLKRDAGTKCTYYLNETKFGVWLGTEDTPYQLDNTKFGVFSESESAPLTTVINLSPLNGETGRSVALKLKEGAAPELHLTLQQVTDLFGDVKCLEVNS